METKAQEALPQNDNEADGSRERVLMIVVRLSAFLCLAGWTWVHLYWEGPYGVLIWHDATYDFAESLGINWDNFVGSGANDGFVQTWVSRIGWAYLLFAVLTLTIRKGRYVQMTLLAVSSGMLTVLTYAKYVSSGYQLPMFVEHGGQILAPLLLVSALTLGVQHRISLCIAIVAVVTTFAGHGSYAVGWWPTPGNFYAMITLTLGLGYESATTMLRCAGVLDFAICLLLFIPRARQFAAGYAAIWGFLTAIARPVAGMSLGLNYWGADQFLHEVVLRSPHFLIPLYLLLAWRRSDAVPKS